MVMVTVMVMNRVIDMIEVLSKVCIFGTHILTVTCPCVANPFALAGTTPLVMPRRLGWARSTLTRSRPDHLLVPLLLPRLASRVGWRTCGSGAGRCPRRR